MERKSIKSIKAKEKTCLKGIKHKKLEYLKLLFFLLIQLVKGKYALNEEAKINLKEMLSTRLKKAEAKKLKIKA
jgi:hypothetical protein